MVTMKSGHLYSGLVLHALTLLAVILLGSSTPGLAAQEIIHVANTMELLQAIGSDRQIWLKDGIYDLSSAEGLETPYVTWRESFDGPGPVISGVNGLVLIAENKGRAKLMLHPRYANVMTFKGGDGITIDGLTIGHGPEPGYCTGAVLQITRSDNVRIKGSDLYGCGTYRLVLSEINHLEFIDSTIRNCTYGIVQAEKVERAEFKDSRFVNNGQVDLLKFTDCAEVFFDRCLFEGNRCEVSWTTYLFRLKSSHVLVQSSKISRNKADLLYFADNEDDLVLIDTVLIDNTFPWGLSAQAPILADDAVQKRIDAVKGNPFQAFSTANWGISEDEVTAREKSIPNGNGNLNWGGRYLRFKSVLIGLPCEVEYRFDDENRLDVVEYLITKEYGSPQDRLLDYAVLRGLLIREYGLTNTPIGNVTDEPSDSWSIKSLKVAVVLSVDKRSAKSIILYFGFTG